jgi:hypothetical protein
MKKMLGGLLLFLLLVGCSGQDNPPPAEEGAQGPSTESLEALSEVAEKVEVDLPDFAGEAHPKALETYKLAYAHQDVLKYIPCFCGCGDTGHEHNLHCFIRDVKPDGEVVWDRMGFT